MRAGHSEPDIMLLREDSILRSIRQRRARRDQARLNGTCIMMEGLFNTLGSDILGMTTIVPLFLAYLGASLETIGAVNTMQSIFGAVVPLLCGGVVAAAKSKRNFSILINGLSRSAILLIPLGVVLGLSHGAELALFFCVIGFYAMCQPITGLTWNYLLGDCVPADRRGKLLGTLYACSGVITFASSAIIKGIRASSLQEGYQYACIFALGGILMACSVLFYLPLKENRHDENTAQARDVKGYIRELITCYRDKLFRRVLFTNVCSSLALSVNAFFYVFAQNVLLLTTDQVSNLIVLQTLGLMLGGMVTGRVSDRLGLKRMLQLIEGLGILVPVMGLIAMGSGAPFLFAAIAVFIIGFTKSGLIGYQAYILEIVPTEKSVYHIVARSLTLLPFSVSGIVIGGVISGASNVPAFIIQIAFACLALLGASTLKLTVYQKKDKQTA